MSGMAGVAAHPQKSMLQAPAAQIVLELPLHVVRQGAFPLGHQGGERRGVLLDCVPRCYRKFAENQP
jgi:hypothetical protein